jgi:NAD-dependent DNA ligase
MATKKEKLDELKRRLNKWRKAYFNGKALVSDEEYDKWEDIYRKHRPNDPFLDKVGAKPNPRNKLEKVKLPFEMPSLKKIYEDKGTAQKWLGGSSGKILALDKLDGVSFGFLKVDGEDKLLTRGNGKIGQDISRLLPKMKKKGRITRSTKVRGELLIPEATFQEKHSDAFENSRNMVSGIVNSKSASSGVSNIRMVAHELIGVPWDKARVKLKNQGFETVYTKLFNNPTLTQLTAHLKDRKEKSKYELDGLVLIDVRNGNRIAFKVNEEAVKVKVKKVEWNISQYGVFKPIVIFDKSVRLSGVSVSKATGHNAAYVQSHKIGPGAIIEVVRAGGVIPKVVGTVKGVKPQLPKNFQWDANKIEALSVQLSTKQEMIVNAKRLTEGLNKLGIEGARIKTAEKLVKHGFDIAELFNASQEEIEETGIGKVNSAKLYTALRKKRSVVSHSEMMSASKCWPKGFSRDKFDLILNEIPFRQLKNKKSQLPSIIGDIGGLSEKTGRVFVKYLPAYYKFLKRLGWLPKKNARSAPNTKGPLSGKSFCFTGFRDKEFEKRIEDMGGQVTSMKSTVSALIVSDKNFNSSKTEKAIKLGIPVLTMQQAQNKFKIR